MKKDYFVLSYKKKLLGKRLQGFMKERSRRRLNCINLAAKTTRDERPAPNAFLWLRGYDFASALRAFTEPVLFS